jgi:hypothetical protein
MSVFSKTKISKTRLIVAVVLTLLAGISVYYYLTFTCRNVPVIVAARDLGPNTIINEKDIKKVDVNVNSKHQKAFSDPKQVIGSTTKDNVYQDMQLISSQLAGKDKKLLQPGETLLPISEAVASPNLRRGNTVNIIVVRADGAFPVGSARVYEVQVDKTVIIVSQERAQQIIGAINSASTVYILAS